jgi:hypothetical protein
VHVEQATPPALPLKGFKKEKLQWDLLSERFSTVSIRRMGWKGQACRHLQRWVSLCHSDRETTEAHSAVAMRLANNHFCYLHVLCILVWGLCHACSCISYALKLLVFELFLFVCLLST